MLLQAFDSIISSPIMTLKKGVKSSQYQSIRDALATFETKAPETWMTLVNCYFNDRPEKPKNWTAISELMSMTVSRALRNLG